MVSQDNETPQRVGGFDEAVPQVSSCLELPHGITWHAQRLGVPREREDVGQVADADQDVRVDVREELHERPHERTLVSRCVDVREDDAHQSIGKIHWQDAGVGQVALLVGKLTDFDGTRDFFAHSIAIRTSLRHPEL